MQIINERGAQCRQASISGCRHGRGPHPPPKGTPSIHHLGRGGYSTAIFFPARIFFSVVVFFHHLSSVPAYRSTRASFLRCRTPMVTPVFCSVRTCSRQSSKFFILYDFFPFCSILCRGKRRGNVQSKPRRVHVHERHRNTRFPPPSALPSPPSFLHTHS